MDTTDKNTRTVWMALTELSMLVGASCLAVALIG